MNVTCTKLDAAIRQLDVAIALLFNDSDPLAIRTLSAAAHGIIADIADSRERGASWRSKIIEDSGLSKKEAFRILNEAQNFLKHASSDPEGTLSFPEEENDHLIFIATIESGALDVALSQRMQAFQVWYLAVYPEKIGREKQIVKNAVKLLPSIEKEARRNSLSKGKEFMLRVLDESA